MSEEINAHSEVQKLYSMFHQEYIIMAEYRMLQSENLPGIYIIPSFEDSFIWFGVIFIRSGTYEGGIFRFTLTLSENFPDNSVPVLTFTSQIYHPAVDAITGKLSLNEVFSQWDRKNNHIWQILKYLHWIFYNFNYKVPANAEASANYKTNKKLYMEKVGECVMLSINHVYDEPPTEDKHYITFKVYDPAIHDNALDLILNPHKRSEDKVGVSWVEPGTLKSFSKGPLID